MNFHHLTHPSIQHPTQAIDTLNSCYVAFTSSFFFYSSPENMLIESLDTERGRNIDMRNFYRLPPDEPQPEWNPHPFGVWDDAQPTEPPSQGLHLNFKSRDKIMISSQNPPSCPSPLAPPKDTDFHTCCILSCLLWNLIYMEQYTV